MPHIHCKCHQVKQQSNRIAYVIVNVVRELKGFTQVTQMQ